MVANIRSGSSLSGALRYNKEKADKNEVANTLLAEDVGTVRKTRTVGCRRLHGELHAVPRSQLQDDQYGFPCLAESITGRQTDWRTTSGDCSRIYGAYGLATSLTLPSNIRISTESISISCRCGSMSRAAHFRTIARPGAQWRFCVTWSANTACIRASRTKTNQSYENELQERKCQAADYVRCAVVHAKLQIIRRHVARYAGLTLYPTMPYARHTFAMTTSLA